MFKQTPSSRLRVVSNFGDSDRGAGENTPTRVRNSGETRCDTREASRLPGISHARVCIFARPTIAIAKIRDYSQSTKFKIS